MSSAPLLIEWLASGEGGTSAAAVVPGVQTLRGANSMHLAKGDKRIVAAAWECKKVARASRSCKTASVDWAKQQNACSLTAYTPAYLHHGLAQPARAPAWFHAVHAALHEMHKQGEARLEPENVPIRP